MNRRKQNKRNKKKQKNTGKRKGGKSGGKKKQTNTKCNKKKQHKQNKNKQTQQLKLKGLFGLDSATASTIKQSDLLISGFVRNIKDECPAEIKNLCFDFASNVFSILSAPQCQLLIDLFINKKIIKNKKQKFNCILSGKYDGFDGEIFHKKCNNKGPTLIVIKSNYDYIFGGYANVPWKKPNLSKGISEYCEDFHSFLFSFYLSTDTLEIYDIDFGHSGFAIQNTLDKGPIFGYSDIVIAGKNCNTENASFCKTSCYKINGDGNKLCGGNDDSVSEGYYRFTVDNYEAFQLKL